MSKSITFSGSCTNKSNDTSRSCMSLVWTRGPTTTTYWAAQDEAWMVKFDRFIWVGSYFKMARKDRSSPNCGQWSSFWWENMWILAIVATDCHSMTTCIAPGDLEVKISQILWGWINSTLPRDDPNISKKKQPRRGIDTKVSLSRGV